MVSDVGHHDRDDLQRGREEPEGETRGSFQDAILFLGFALGLVMWVSHVKTH